MSNEEDRNTGIISNGENQPNGIKLNANQIKSQHIDIQETKTIISKRQKRPPLVDEQNLDFLNETERESLFYQNNRKTQKTSMVP
jgi:hypothetical protein